MTITTIDIRIQVGSTVHHLDEVGDPNDVMFALQVGRAVSLALIGHQEEQ